MNEVGASEGRERRSERLLPPLPPRLSPASLSYLQVVDARLLVTRLDALAQDLRAGGRERGRVRERGDTPRGADAAGGGGPNAASTRASSLSPGAHARTERSAVSLSYLGLFDPDLRRPGSRLARGHHGDRVRVRRVDAAWRRHVGGARERHGGCVREREGACACVCERTDGGAGARRVCGAEGESEGPESSPSFALALSPLFHCLRGAPFSTPFPRPASTSFPPGVILRPSRSHTRA